MSTLETGSALLMGFMGSVHCVAMCGPIASVVCAGERRSALWPQVGRISTYVGLGALAGVAGSALSERLPLALVQLGARVAAALVLVAVGFYAAGILQRVGVVERLTAPLFRRVGGLLARDGGASIAARVAQGAVWGLVPCGLVYGALGLAALSGSASSGASVMLAFGAGTLPALIAVGLFADGFRRLMRNGRIRRSAGLLLAAAGTVHLALAFQSAGALPFATPSAGEAAPPARPCCHHGP